jgi:3-phenylpropionate/trans-cinnamate dioxygenase ferredoxin subunit
VTARAYVVATATEIPPGGRKIVDLAGRSVGVFNLDGSYFALRNTCPHAGGPLCEGVLSGFVSSSEPGHYTYERRGEFLRCPWHQWEFDIRTGQSWLDPLRTRVRRYRAGVETGAELLAENMAPERAGRAQGPYAAEIYPVTRDGEFVVVHI